MKDLNVILNYSKDKFLELEQVEIECDDLTERNNIENILKKNNFKKSDGIFRNQEDYNVSWTYNNLAYTNTIILKNSNLIKMIKVLNDYKNFKKLIIDKVELFVTKINNIKDDILL